MDIQFLQHRLLKRSSFPRWMVLATCWNKVIMVIWPYIFQGIFLGSLFYSTGLHICPYSSHMFFCLLYLWKIWNPKSKFSSFVLFQDCFGFVGSLWFLMNFSMDFSGSAKKKNVIGILVEIPVEPVDHCEKYYLNIKFSNPWTWAVFPVIFIFHFFQQCFAVFSAQTFHLLISV